ncbi:MAG: AI-2E family transporter [Bacteroidales bacterium]|nr:AI-2E family transporter [Bacteroidales bacterium]
MLKDYPRSIRYTFTLLAIFLTLFGIIQAREFLYPLVFGALLAYLLYPMANFFEKKLFPRVFSILLSEIIGIIIIYGIALFLVRQVSRIIDDFPELRQQAIHNVSLFLSSLEAQFGISDKKIENFLRSVVEGLFTGTREQFNKLFVDLAGTVLKMALLPVYVFLFLFYRTKFAYFILKTIPKERHLVTINVLRKIATVATRYMGGVFIVVLILAVINSTALTMIGVRYAILLGISASLFSFIPYFGNVIGGTYAVLFSLLVMPSPVFALKVAILYFLVHAFENNILSPNIVGDAVEINPFFVILGLIGAGMVWGVPGMIVIIPVLAVTKIIFDNVPALMPYGYLLGPKGTRHHSLTGENLAKFLKRINKFFQKIITGKNR